LEFKKLTDLCVGNSMICRIILLQYNNLFKSDKVKYVMVSLLSALEIQENETFVSSYENQESGKHGYAITHGEEGRYRPIISCSAIYDSKNDALTAGNESMRKIKEWDLDAKRKSLVDAVGGEKTAQTIDAIVQASKQ